MLHLAGLGSLSPKIATTDAWPWRPYSTKLLAKERTSLSKISPSVMRNQNGEFCNSNRHASSCRITLGSVPPSEFSSSSSSRLCGRWATWLQGRIFIADLKDVGNKEQMLRTAATSDLNTGPKVLPETSTAIDILLCRKSGVVSMRV